jgi:hypothetical protein
LYKYRPTWPCRTSFLKYYSRKLKNGRKSEQCFASVLISLICEAVKNKVLIANCFFEKKRRITGAFGITHVIAACLSPRGQAKTIIFGFQSAAGKKPFSSARPVAVLPQIITSLAYYTTYFFAVYSKFIGVLGLILFKNHI